ncbi:DMT family transporter [Tranquillimonas alkanivorans]|uniref:Permease of the drug/metabolite transporter (DMT) superfamily n=1 Tax=Tranquillimonas alkanivorans TaxID=441119 RepID=A0A1I5QCL8_9RHOB|nr:DMT family transporter [Tranquillimonas alkanivorans]SFP44048.1 Permease of the drug/metabolite transporter (DMT) superfamily [Tranquillimonas alkanivorans]
MSEARGKEDRTLAGLLTMCAAVACFTSIDTSAKWLILAGLPPLQVVLMRYAGHFVLSLLFFMPSDGPAAFRSVSPGRQFLRSSLLLGSTVCNFTALNWLPITVTTAIFFAGPIAVTLLSIPVLGERVGVRRLVAVIVGFSGVLIVVQPWGAEFHPAMFLSLAAMTCAALYFVMTRMLAGEETNATSQLWSSGLATVCIAPFALPGWQWPDTGPEITVALAIGCFGGVGHYLATAAHRLADASVLAPVVYLQLLFATIAGIVVFATYPSLWTLAGAMVIVGSGIYIWSRETRAGR